MTYNVFGGTLNLTQSVTWMQWRFDNDKDNSGCQNITELRVNFADRLGLISSIKVSFQWMSLFQNDTKQLLHVGPN